METRVTNVYTGIPQPPREVGETQFTKNSKDITCYLQTGPAFFGIVEGYGKTEEEAERAVWRRFDDLRAERRPEPTVETCPLCSKPLGGAGLPPLLRLRLGHVPRR